MHFNQKLSSNLKKLCPILGPMVISFAFVLSINAQDQIDLYNPSFEDEPADATMPMGWFACAEGTTPDILPGYWGVYEDPSDGETFVGLITRNNGTYESIGQRLPHPLKKDLCYTFTMDMAHSDHYSGYNESIKLRIWISSKKCAKEQLIYESDFIKNSDWESHQIEFNPEQNCEYIKFEAYYKEGNFSRESNILLDNISSIFFCDRA